MKTLIWIGSSKKDLSKLPEDIKEAFTFGLRLAQAGKKHTNGKPLQGFGGAHIIELVEDDRSGTYRAMYTTKMPGVIFVLHVFQKKSKHGIATPKQDMDLIKSRFKWAQELYKEMYE